MNKIILSLGSDIDSSLCIMNGEEYNIIPYPDNKNNLKEHIKKELKELIPNIIVCDKHPSYGTIPIAEALAIEFNAKLVKVQHHKAHIATVAAEHNLREYIGIAMDGLGFGEDGTIWGGEVFKVKNNNFERIGHLEYQKQLGDTATIFPVKMLYGILTKFMSEEEIIKLNLMKENESKLCVNAIKEGFNITNTSSTGRVLDSVSVLLGFCKKMTYGGEPAIELEKNSSKEFENLEPEIIEENKFKILSTTKLFKYLIDNLEKNKSELATTAQMYIAKGIYTIAKEENLPIVFSGGVAYNKIIKNYLASKEVLFNKNIEPGDKGLSFGQAIIAKE